MPRAGLCPQRLSTEARGGGAGSRGSEGPRFPSLLVRQVPRVLCALAELYRYAHASNGTRSNLEKAIAMHQECKTWFVVAFRLMESPTNRRKSVLLLSPSLASPCLTPKSAAEQAQLEHLKALIAEQSALVCKYVKEDLMLFLKANRPTAQEYQSVRLLPPFCASRHGPSRPRRVPLPRLLCVGFLLLRSARATQVSREQKDPRSY